MTNQRQRTRILEGAMADVWQQEPDDEPRPNAIVEAQRHLASLSPERRAMLQAEWEN